METNTKVDLNDHGVEALGLILLIQSPGHSLDPG